MNSIAFFLAVRLTDRRAHEQPASFHHPPLSGLQTKRRSPGALAVPNQQPEHLSCAGNCAPALYTASHASHFYSVMMDNNPFTVILIVSSH